MEVVFMAVSKIAITLDNKIVQKLDSLVQSRSYPSRSRAIQDAVEEKLMRLEKSRLIRECAKLDPEFEQSLAEEAFFGEDETWPEY
jgi:Arc/MetJ-type ribon-helix-helix transcriptional regulator